jgi:integrase
MFWKALRRRQADELDDAPDALRTLPLFRTFEAVADEWLRARRPLVSGRHRYMTEQTLRCWGFMVMALNKFLGNKTMDEIGINPEILTEYQLWRSPTAGPSRINREVGLCIRILKQEGVWTRQHANRYRPFSVKYPDVPRAMTPAEQELWLRTARSQRKWDWVYWYTILGLRTTASTWELRTLKLKNINLDGKYIQVASASAKGKYRIRTIPLTADALEAAQKLLERARRLGASEPGHYLFPRHIALHYDPTRHLSSVRWWWDEIRAATGLYDFKPYDLRHTAITRLAEAGTPIWVIMSMAGHVERRMTEHYVWISEQAKRKALEAGAEKRMYDARERPDPVPNEWDRDCLQSICD